MDLCRLCNIETNLGLHENIFNESLDPPLWKIIADLANLTILEGDPFTKLVCYQCLDQLQKFHSFRRIILSTNWKIRHINNNNNTSNNDDIKRLPENVDNNNDYYPELIDTVKIEDYVLKEEQIEIDENCLEIENQSISDDDQDQVMINDQNDDTNIKEELTNDSDKVDNSIVNDDSTTINNGNHNAQAASFDLLPEKSKTKYMLCYNKFVKWKEAEGTTSWSEDVILSYFVDQALKYAPTTLWSIYSMLRTTISSQHNINIAEYSRLLSFLKKKKTGFQSKKSKVFSTGEISQFLHEAPDKEYLFMKVVAILGVLGACRGADLCDMKVADFEDLEQKLLKITIPTTKPHKSRSFTVEGEYYKIIKKYANLRPNNVESRRFFLNYQKGKCTRQVVGKNKIADCPKQIAKFLNLSDSKEYTGHSFRRTSATLLANSGADITTIKRHGGWKLTTTAEGFNQ